MTSKRKNPEELSPLKIIGRILEVLALPILIIVAVLENIPNKNLEATDVLLVIGVSLFFIGLILSHLPLANNKRNDCIEIWGVSKCNVIQ